MAIVGQGSGESPEAAEGAARADLLRAIAERVQVDVDYQAESVLEHQRVGDGVDEHQTATESTRARADLGAAVRAAAQVVARHDELRARPGGQPQHLTFLLAKVPSALFDAARIERRLAKERARGAKVVAVTSAAPTSAPTRDLIAGLERRLLLEPRYTLTEPLPPPLAADRTVVVRVRRTSDQLQATLEVRRVGQRSGRVVTLEATDALTLEDRAVPALLALLQEAR